MTQTNMPPVVADHIEETIRAIARLDAEPKEA